MPTVPWVPRPASLRYYFRTLERRHLSQTVEALTCFLLFQFRKRCAQFRQNVQNRRGLISLMMTLLTICDVTDDFNRIRPSNYYPPAGFYPMGANDPYWVANEHIFLKQFRFRRAHFLQLIEAMKLDGIVFRCGTFRKKHKYRADVCIMVVLRRLSYPCRFSDLVLEFGIPSNRLCEIFHDTLDYIFKKYHKLIDLMTWAPFFPAFADEMKRYGSPFDDLIGLTDGNFMACCRPGGLGNHHSKLDQSQLYTGEKARHGVKHLGAFFPNGMMALAGPFLGSVHDGRMLRDSGWIDMLRLAYIQDGRRRFKLFGDSAFPVSNFIQAMVKGNLNQDARRFNALMSRIRIHIENAFAGLSNTFTFLSFQFTHALGHPMPITITELIHLCE